MKDDDLITLRSTNMLMTKLNIFGFNGKCIEVIFCSANTIGTFITLLYESTTSNRHYLLCKYELLKNTIACLNIAEIQFVISAIIEQDKQFNFQTKINEREWSSLINIISKTAITTESDILIETNNLKVLFGNGLKNYDSSPEMAIGSHILSVNNLCIIQHLQFSTCSFEFGIKDINSISNYSYYNDVSLYYSIGQKKFIEIGTIVKACPLNEKIKLFMQPYSMEILNSIRLGKTEFKDIINPFTIIRYLLESSDIGLKGINIEGEKAVESTYLVASAIKNIKLNCEAFSIGDVRFGETVTISENFVKTISVECKDNYTIVWTYQNAYKHFEAAKKGKAKIENALNLLLFFTKSDMPFYNFGLSDQLQQWEIKNHYPLIQLINNFYIENCYLGEKIIISGDEMVEPSCRVYSTEEVDQCLNNWVELGYDYILEENKKLTRIMYAIRWINKCWNTENNFDKVIYAIMALEFCLNGEKGNGIIEDILESKKN